MEPYENKAAGYQQVSPVSQLTRIALPAAIVGGLALILYFLAVKVFDFHTQTQLRYFNFLFLVPVALYTIQKYIATASEKTYLKAMGSSVIACSISYLLLSAFMFTYLNIDKEFMQLLYQEAWPHLQLRPVSIFALLMGEGIIGSVIVSFVVMQFYKDRIRKLA